MIDDIRSLTAQLAEDPASLVFLALGEALRRRRQLDAALKVAQTGVARHPRLADAHDLLARILADRGDPAAAFDAWSTALERDPEHLGATKGLGFLYYQAGEYVEALRFLDAAAQRLPDDAGLAAAVVRVRERVREGGQERERELAERPTPPPVAPEPAAPEPAAPEPAALEEIASPADTPAEAPEAPEAPAIAEAQLFAGFEGADSGLLLLDAAGLRLGGGLRSPAGDDVADAVAAQLAGVSREAMRAARLLGLGDWQSVAAESPDGNLHLVAPTAGTVLLTLRDPSVPAARLAVLAERAAGVARRWLEAAG